MCPLTGQIEERWSQDNRHIRPQLGVGLDFYRPSLPLEAMSDEFISDE
jgi:hypothetical protein